MAPRRAFALAILCVALALPGLSSSCAFNLPRSTCKATDVSALRLGSGGTDPSCTSCLEDRCCDDLGYCTEDTESRCAERVKDAHACVLAAGLRGALAESECKSRLGGVPHATSLYRCMRDQCGERCGLPSCQVAPAAREFVSPSCDRCVSTSCCREVNRCYGNRTCQLTLECISRRCAPVLAADLGNALDAGGGSFLSTFREEVCSPAGAVPDAAAEGDAAALGISNCETTCIAEYGAAAIEPSDDVAEHAACLAFDFFACAARAGCASECAVLTDAGAADALDAAADADAR